MKGKQNQLNCVITASIYSCIVNNCKFTFYGKYAWINDDEKVRLWPNMFTVVAVLAAFIIH